MISWSFAFYCFEWLLRLWMLAVIVRRRHQPSTAVAWLMVIFFMPTVGAILYFLVGSYRFPRRRVRRYLHLLREINHVTEQFHDHPHIVRPQVSPQAEAAVVLAQRLGQMPILGGNRVQFLTRTEEVIARLVEDIDKAQHHVHLLYYIYSPDETGRLVSDALVRAAKRGVQCRLLVDAVGSRAFLHREASRLADQGVEVRAALPVGIFRRTVARIDVRNHRKLAIIDGQIGYAGSHNITNPDYGTRGLVWHDVTVRLEGPATLELQSVFTADWFFETDQVLDAAEYFPPVDWCGSIPIQTLPSGPAYPTENYQRMVVAAIHAAQHRIVITTPYFIPDEPFIQAVEVAVLRGVDVSIILPIRCDKPLVGAAARAYCDQLLEIGAHIYLFRPGLLHAKTMTVDDQIAFVGSGNFDIRSFSLNFELNLLLYQQQVTQELFRLQQAYIQQSEPLDKLAFRRRPSAVKTFDSLARLLSPLL